MMMSAEEVIGYIGFITSVLFFSTPMRNIYNLYYKKCKVDEFSGVFLFLSFSHCLMWFVLGIDSNKEYLFWCNFIGILLNFIWCVSYINFFTDGKKVLFFAYIFAIINISIEIMYFESLITKDNTEGKDIPNEGEEKLFTRKVFEWIISAIINPMMYFTPGFNIVSISP